MRVHDGDGEKMLVVDDEPDVLKLLAMRLTTNGYRVVAAHDSAQAISLAYWEKPTLVILDDGMSGKDGYSIL